MSAQRARDEQPARTQELRGKGERGAELGAAARGNRAEGGVEQS